MSQPARRKYSPEEYLALEEKSETKNEYYQGEIYAMAGASYNHNVITGNIISVMNQNYLDKPCVAFTSDMRMLVNSKGLYTYPDVSVVCGQIEFAPERTDTITNPSLIVEVILASTRNYDRKTKFALYRALPSLQEYLLVDQDSVLVDYYQRLEADKWLLQTFASVNTSITLEAPGLVIPLSRIYNKVDFSL